MKEFGNIVSLLVTVLLAGASVLVGAVSGRIVGGSNARAGDYGFFGT